VAAWDELGKLGPALRIGYADVFRTQGAQPAEAQGVDLQAAAVLECLEAHEGTEDRIRADDDAVVLEQDDIVAFCEGVGNHITERLAAGQTIVRHRDRTADRLEFGGQAHFGQNAGDAEGYQAR